MNRFRPNNLLKLFDFDRRPTQSGREIQFGISAIRDNIRELNIFTRFSKLSSNYPVEAD